MFVRHIQVGGATVELTTEDERNLEESSSAIKVEGERYPGNTCEADRPLTLLMDGLQPRCHVEGSAVTNADGRGILVDIFMSQELNRPTLDERIFDALIRDGYQARREHRLDAARKSFTEAMNLARLSLGENQAALATALNGLAQAERDLQRNDAALRNYEEAVEIFRGLNDPLRLAHTVRHIGDILLDDDRLQEAMPHYDGALKIYREQKQTSSLDYANAVRGYALLNAKMGNAGQAASLWKEAGRIYEAYGIQTGVEGSRRRVVQLEKKES